jgi:AcrR family transcriptional regulator
MLTGADKTEAADGRRLRSADSRRRIIQALLELVQQGHHNPGAEDVAQRAGVGLRTVFRLFKDMESLTAEMMVPQRQEFIDCFNARYVSPRGPGRIMELYARLAKLFERRMPIRRAGIIRQYDSPALRAGMRELDEAIIAFIQRNAPDALTADAGRMEMLSLLTSYDAWMRLRDAQGLTFEQAYALLAASIGQLIGQEFNG